MNENTQYKIGGSFLTRAELIKDVGDRVKNMDQATAKEYISLVSKQLEFDMSQERLLQENKVKEDKFRTRIMPSIGLLLVIAMVGWAYFFPFPSTFQSGIFWTSFCLFVAIACYFVTGYFHIEQKIGEVAVKAGGPMGVFFLLLFNPPVEQSRKNVDQFNRKIDVVIMTNDTTLAQKISVDLNPLDQTEITVFAKRMIKDYYGPEIVDTFTCFRHSDGKIIDREKCSSLGNESIMAVSVKAIRQFKSPHDAYEYLLKKIE